VAQADGPDLASSAALRVWIVGRNGVRLRVVHVEPQELAEERLAVLSVAVRISRRAAVPHPDVEHAVRTESQASAIVIGIGLIHLEHELARGRISHIGVTTDLIALDVRVAVLVRVVYIEESVARVCGMKRQTQQPALASIAHLAGEVEKGSREELS